MVLRARPIDDGAMQTEMKKLIEELALWTERANAEVNRRMAKEDPTYRDLEPDLLVPGPPASPAEIDALEARWAHPLPADYRTFLALHDGCRGYSGEANLLSTEDQRSDEIRKALRWKGTLFAEFGERNPVADGALPVVLAPTVRDFVLLEWEAKAGKAWFVHYDDSEELRRFGTFVELVEHHIGVLRGIVAE